jgi:hypothetical protein
MVTNTGKVLYPTTPYQNNGVLLQGVSFTRDIRRDLNMVG